MYFSTRLPRIALLLVTLAVPSLPPPAAAQLMIAPTRVVLAGAERSTELILVNKSDTQTAYRIDLENHRMRRDGSLEAATDTRTGELFAADMIRFSPRRVILESGARQSLRVSVTPPAGLAPGEYRSHLRVMAAPTNAGTATTAPAEDEGGESQEEEQGHTQESPLCTATTPEVLAVAQQVLCGLVGG